MDSTFNPDAHPRADLGRFTNTVHAEAAAVPILPHVPAQSRVPARYRPWQCVNLAGSTCGRWHRNLDTAQRHADQLGDSSWPWTAKPMDRQEWQARVTAQQTPKPHADPHPWAQPATRPVTPPGGAAQLHDLAAAHGLNMMGNGSIDEPGYEATTPGGRRWGIQYMPDDDTPGQVHGPYWQTYTQTLLDADGHLTGADPVEGDWYMPDDWNGAIGNLETWLDTHT